MNFYNIPIKIKILLVYYADIRLVMFFIKNDRQK